MCGMYKNKVAVSNAGRQQPRKRTSFPPWKIVRWAWKLSSEKKRLVVELVESRNIPAVGRAREHHRRVSGQESCSMERREPRHSSRKRSLLGKAGVFILCPQRAKKVLINTGEGPQMFAKKERSALYLAGELETSVSQTFGALLCALGA